MKKLIRRGVDVAKNYFQLHALAREDEEPRTRQLSRQGCANSFPGSTPAGMEACASSHYWSFWRWLTTSG